MTRYIAIFFSVFIVVMLSTTYKTQSAGSITMAGKRNVVFNTNSILATKAGFENFKAAKTNSTVRLRTSTINNSASISTDCPSDITVGNDPSQAGAVVNYTTPTVPNGHTIDSSPASGSFFPLGTTTVTITDTNGASNISTSCSFNVTVNDTQPPTISCPSNISVNNTSGQAGAVVNYAAPTVSDNALGVTTSASPASGSFFSIGTTTVTVTATDASGNTASCSFTVTVIDNDPPTANCPSNITVNNTSGQAGAIVNYTNISVPNGHTLVASPASGSFFPIGTTTVTVTITKGSSNNTASCSFTVTVIDNDPPTANCPSNITVSNTTGQAGAVVNYTAPTVSDNAPGVTSSASPASGSFFPIGTTTVSVTATDTSGNTASCSFTVTVTDTESPTISCPSNIIVNNDSGQAGAVVNYPTPTVSDNAPGVTSSASPASGSFFPIGTTTVTVAATDASGNTASCSFTVTVNDTESPTINCTADVVVNTTPGQCGALVNYAAPTVSDNAPGVTSNASPASGSFFPFGTTTVTVTATDGSGNTASCSFNVTVNDSGVPVITSQPVGATRYSGDLVSFSVTANGTSPLHYQWRKDGNPISNATGSSFTIRQTNLANAGSYDVIVTNGCGSSITSSSAILKVYSFTLSLSPDVQVLPLDGATSYTISAQVQGTGAPSSLSLNLSGLPSGIAINNFPSTLSFGSSATFALKADTKSGNSTFTVTGTTPEQSNTASALLIVLPVITSSEVRDTDCNEITDEINVSIKPIISRPDIDTTNPNSFKYNVSVKNTGSTANTVSLEINFPQDSDPSGLTTSSVFTLVGLDPVKVYTSDPCAPGSTDITPSGIVINTQNGQLSQPLVSNSTIVSSANSIVIPTINIPAGGTVWVEAHIGYSPLGMKGQLEGSKDNARSHLFKTNVIFGSQVLSNPVVTVFTDTGLKVEELGKN
jgi:hypothetical protein